MMIQRDVLQRCLEHWCNRYNPLNGSAVVDRILSAYGEQGQRFDAVPELDLSDLELDHLPGVIKELRLDVLKLNSEVSINNDYLIDRVVGLDTNIVRINAPFTDFVAVNVYDPTGQIDPDASTPRYDDIHHPSASQINYRPTSFSR